MKSADRKRTVLIIDDDRGLLRLIEKALQREGFGTATASSGAEALSWLANNTADLLLLDLKLQDFQGRDLIRSISERQATPPFIIITGQGDERVAVEMMKIGARDYLVKDVDFLQFVPEVVSNVMEQLETERRLAAAEAQIHLIQSVVEQGFSAVLIASRDLPDPHVVYINPACEQLIGFSAAQLVGQPLSRISGMETVRQRLQKGVPENQRFAEDVSAFQAAGGERWVEWRIGPVRDKTGEPTHWLIIMRDITERRRLEKEILEINDRVQRRIGQDLHDGLCQQLAGIELMSQALERKIATRSKADAARVRDIAGHVREAISQARLMARGLSPILLEAEGLMSGLQELAANTEKFFGIECVFECRPPVLVNDHATATHLFRIAQEAVSNAIRHGKARRVIIGLEQGSEKLRLCVRDDGRGMAAIPPDSRGMGLHIMQSRAGTIGGELTVENAAEGGVRVTCEVALPDRAEQTGQQHGGKTETTQGAQADPHR